MKTIIKQLYLILFICLFIACQTKSPKSVTISVTNNTSNQLSDILIEILTDSIKNVIDFSDKDKIVIKTDEKNVPFQIIDKDGDGISDKILFMANVGPNATSNYTILSTAENQIYEFKKRTQAEISVKEGGEWKWITKENGNEQYEYQGGTWKNVNVLKVPVEHTDHSFYIRYEGPGWESDLVGYRFYLDWRNASDIYGKRVDTMVLQGVGLDGFDSYHEMQPWGQDILKVGNSLGIGTPGYWNGKSAQRIDITDSLSTKIIEDGVIYSKIATHYYGWKVADSIVDAKWTLSIHAGTRLTKSILKINKDIDNLCTGIVKHLNTKLIQPETTQGDWLYLATWGLQSLANDSLGMAVFYKSSDLIEITEDEESHVIVLKPNNNTIKYYFAAAWEKEKNGIKNINEFKEYLEATINTLNNPVKVEIK